MMNETTTWLLAGDPAVRWQVLRDLLDATSKEIDDERAKVAEFGWGRMLLDLEEDGQWAGGACFPAPTWDPPSSVVGERDTQPWTGTYPTLRLLQTFGVDPNNSDMRAIVERVRETCRWEYDNLPFFDGEVEPCINGGALAISAYFGQDPSVIVERLLSDQLADGGWNCEATTEEGRSGSQRSSFHTTICVLEGLLTYERSGGGIDVTSTRRDGEEYLLARGLMHKHSTGELVDPTFLDFSFPPQWYYDVLRALDYLRDVGGVPDSRLIAAIEHVRSKRQTDGTWLLENTHPGMQWFSLEAGDGQPSRWNTLRALRVLRWYDR